MPDLSFQVESAQAIRHAAAPLLGFGLRIANAVAGEAIHSILLRCQIQIDAVRREYGERDHERLLDLFGEPGRWSRTLHSVLWAITTTAVPPFTGDTLTELQVPCTFDFNAATAKYFYALDGGEVPITLLFSGTVYYAADDGRLQIAQIPWSCEASWNLPVQVWQDMMHHYYPNIAWLCLRQDVFDRLYRYKLQHGLPTWEHVLEALLAPEANGKTHEPEPGR